MMDGFDTPLFKILANNDTGKAPGHQGGIVIPTGLGQYFPQLENNTSEEQPTVDILITAILFDGANYLDNVQTRYQYQTWGGERSPERRLTGNLGPIRNLAAGGDILLIERSVRDELLYRLTLIRQDSADYGRMAERLGSNRWGPLERDAPPVEEQLVRKTAEAITERENEAFELFDGNALITETRVQRIARSRAFQSHIAKLYERRCAICNTGLIHPVGGRYEPHAAHIIPRSLRGADDARNGLLLCRTHHWAFDEGLIGINPDYRVLVPPPVLAVPENGPLATLSNRPIRLPHNARLIPSAEALIWHMNNILLA